ncbi:MAG TPA: aldo/keto reductase [Stellaceae bacterium]|nr:aldo/keto reductase [Stellaceae bacterium]
MPAIGFGTWSLRGWRGRRAIDRALGLGYRHIDTAQLYENEGDVGRAMRSSGVDRGEVFLVTKLRRENLGADAVRRSADESLRQLATDYVDLLLIHWPNNAIPLAETLEAMSQLREVGKARFIGVCNFGSKSLAEAVETCHANLLCDQVEYHPFLSQAFVRDAARRLGMIVVAYSPLARGRVEGDPTIRALAAKYGKTPAQIALRWLIEQHNVAAIPKARSAAHAAENLAVFDFTLAAEDRIEIDRLGQVRNRIQERESDMPEWDPA